MAYDFDLCVCEPAYKIGQDHLAKSYSSDINASTHLTDCSNWNGYDTIRYIYVRSKADKMASLV